MKKSIFLISALICFTQIRAQVLKSTSTNARTGSSVSKTITQPAQTPVPTRDVQLSPRRTGSVSTEAPVLTGVYKQAIRSNDGRPLEVLYTLNSDRKNAMTGTNSSAKEKSVKRFSKNPQHSGNNDWDCNTENVRVNIFDDSYMKVSVKSQAANIYPGFIYKFQNYINGSWKNETGDRKPIIISASVENMSGSPQETIQEPDINSTRNAIVNLFGRFTRKAEEIATGGYKVQVEEITSTSDLDIKVGATGYGGGFSGSNNFQFQKKTNARSFLFDCTKEMFTLDVAQPSGGFFNDPSRTTSDMMYISSVTYGLRIIALMQFEIADESVNNNFKASYDAIVGGGTAAIDVAKTVTNNKATINMFVVGGQSNTVYTEYTIDAMKLRLQEIQKNLNYNNSAPILYNFKNMNNELVRYSSATDWFSVTNCEPKSESDKGAAISTKIEFIRIDNQSEDDVDLYGTIRAELIDGAGNKVAPQYGNPYLLNLKSNEYIRKEELKNYGASLPVNNLTFLIEPGNVTGAKVLVHYWLNDRDGGSGDDPVKMRGRDADYLINGNKHYVQTIYLDELKRGSSIQRQAQFVDEDGDYPFTITINVERK